MKKFFFIIFSSTTLFAMEYAPWLTPLWEFESKVGYFYSHTERVESPAGSFKYVDNYHEIFGSLGTTIWPDLNVEAELVFGQSKHIPFSYEVFTCTGRKVFLDDVCGDWITATLGVTLAFPSTRILEDFNYGYHGHVNSELHLAVGREYRHYFSKEWKWRFWGLLGCGIAERGKPWIHGLLTFDQSLSRCSRLTLYTELLYGLGNENIQPFSSFKGYGLIDHRTIDFGGAWHYDLGVYATFTVLGYINLYARNFTDHAFGGSVMLTIPFGI